MSDERDNLGLTAQYQVPLKSLDPYRHLFPKALVIDQTIKMGANVSDTVKFIPEVVKQTAWQVKRFVDQEFSGMPLDEACKKLWWWVKEHIEYRKDERGIEQVRSPRRLIHDGFGDCDCMTTFIHACLYSLGVKRIVRRITEYENLGYFQHIYTLVPCNGSNIIMDTVWNDYNSEKAFTKKEDYKMELQFLDGIDDEAPSIKGIDAQDLLSNRTDFGELGKLLKKKAQGGGGSAPKKGGGLFKKKTPEQKQAKKEQRKEKVKKVGQKTLKVVNKVNKVNPATVLLRAGILASFKLNVMKVAENIKWGYASRELAQSKGMDMSKYDKLKTVLAKCEKIFFAAGGKPENMKKAILTGRGNRNHEVAGIQPIDGMNEETPLSELLGAIHTDEFVYGMEEFSGFEGLEGFDELGEPATAASITAAAGAMGAMAALVASVGALFPKKDKAAKEKKGKKKGGDESAAPGEGGGESPQPGEDPAQEETPAPEAENTEAPATEEAPAEETPAPAEEAPAETIEAEEVPNEEPAEETTEGLEGPFTRITSFFQKHQKIIIPTGIVLLAAGITWYFLKDDEEEQAQKQPQLLPPQPQLQPAPMLNTAVHGFKQKRTYRKKGGDELGEQEIIALM